MRRPLAASSTECRKTRMSGTGTKGHTEAEKLLLDRQERSSKSMLLVVGLLRRWTLKADNDLVRSEWNHLIFPGGPEDDQESWNQVFGHGFNEAMLAS